MGQLMPKVMSQSSYNTTHEKILVVGSTEPLCLCHCVHQRIDPKTLSSSVSEAHRVVGIDFANLYSF